MKITEEQIKELGLIKCKYSRIEIYVEADINDGDYINESTIVNSIQLYKNLKDIAFKIKNYGRHNWRNREDYLTEEEEELFSDYVPYLDNENVHTIEDISFTIIINGVIYK